jgi:hypothetical protein
MAGDARVRFGPTAHPLYDEMTLSAGTTNTSYTSPQIPAGIAYTVMAVVGESLSGEFVPLDYGSAEGIRVTQGGSTAVSLTLEPAPSIGTTDLLGVNVTGVTVNTNTGEAYASTDHALYSFYIPPSESSNLLAQVPDAVINSLSLGESYNLEMNYYSTPWLNTDRGILPFDRFVGSLVPGYATGSGVQNVIRSLSMRDPLDNAIQIPIYLRDMGLGYTIAPNGVLGAWLDVDFSQYLGGTRMYDMDCSAGFVYVATSAGAYRIPTTALVAGATAQSVISASRPFTAGTLNERIISIAVVHDGTGEREVLYMGTERGVYWATLDELSDAVFYQPAVLIPETAGKPFRKMKAVNYYDYYAGLDRTLIACFDSTGVVIINHDNSSETLGILSTLPFYAGLPSDIPQDLTQMAWCFPGYEVDLLIAGKKGLVYYYTLPFNSP